MVCFALTLNEFYIFLKCLYCCFCWKEVQNWQTLFRFLIVIHDLPSIYGTQVELVHRPNPFHNRLQVYCCPHESFHRLKLLLRSKFSKKKKCELRNKENKTMSYVLQSIKERRMESVTSIGVFLSILNNFCVSFLSLF